MAPSSTALLACCPLSCAARRDTAIPVHDATAPLRDPELFHCATEIGARPEDVISGKNQGRTKFQAVAVEDAATTTLALHLRVVDATPQPLTARRLAGPRPLGAVARELVHRAGLR